ncbi:MAG TPA: acetyl-CoA hydrolase/transferase C-terminal domain-containing protein [Dehalococcoidia bacterium]|nr:acetyl-CoA hydrolase/transferase C-terminal domain-containing protein [Dehalococcoidia bacterium]
MGWQEDYKRKLTTHDEAVRVVKSGDLVVFPLVPPWSLAQALAKRREELRDVTVRVTSPIGDPGWYDEQWAQAFTDFEFELFIGDPNRHVTDSGRGTYLPNVFSVEFKAIDERPGEVRKPDVVFVNVSPPNKNGYVNFGVHMWNKRAYARRARTVVAEVVPQPVIAHGDCWMHVSEIDLFVEGTGAMFAGAAGAGGQAGGPLAAYLEAVPEDRRPGLRQVLLAAERSRLQQMLPEIGPRLADYTPETLAQALQVNLGPPEHVKAIAGYVSEVVPDGATLQIGIGEPARWLASIGTFDGKHDLGIHTELGCPGLAKLFATGVVTNRRKTIHNGVAIAVAWTGCDNEDMAIIDDNPHFQVYDPEYVLNLRTIMANENMVAINNAISVDLLGQINSESVFGGRMINGTGGQPEMHIGAFSAKGGRAITLLPSTALGGTVSKIVPQLDAGAIVTIPRYYADTVITEYGIARLAGKSHRQRASELIAIAHPDFRAELRREAERLWARL